MKRVNKPVRLTLERKNIRRLEKREIQQVIGGDEAGSVNEKPDDGGPLDC